MFFKKFFVGFLLVFSIEVQAVHANDVNDYVSNLGEVAMAPGALKIALETINDIATDKSTSENIAKLANAIEQIRKTKHISKAQHLLRNKNPYLSLEYMNKTSSKLKELRSTNYKNIQANNRWATHISEIVGTPLETISVLTASYSLLTRDYKKLSPVESIALGINDSLSIGVGVANISQMVYSKVPTRAYAKFLSQNPISKNLLKASKTSAASVLSGIILGAQIESYFYQKYRDEAIKSIKDNIFGMHISQVNSRNTIVKKLSELLITNYFDDTQIQYGEILTILQNHSVVIPQYSPIMTGQTIVLSNEFREFTLDNSKYLNDNYAKSTFNDLTNEEKIYTAIDALAYVATIEDDEVYHYLITTVNNGATVADVLFGSLEGSSMYEIYNTTDLQNKMFPYLLMEDKSAYNFYGDIYKVIVNGAQAEAELKRRAELGKEVIDMRNKEELLRQEEEAENNRPRLDFILPKDTNISRHTIHGQVGDTITFTPYITAKDFIHTVNKPFSGEEVGAWDGDNFITITGDNVVYKLWYYNVDDDTTTGSVEVNYDHITGTFSFVMPIVHMGITSMSYEHRDYPRVSMGVGLPEKWININDTVAPVDVNLSNGLIAYYEFEGDANDSSGNGNDGVEYGGVSYVDGMIGQAGSFDGVDDYVIGNKILPFNGQSKYSISGWFNTNSGGEIFKSTSNGVGTSRSGGISLTIGSSNGFFGIGISSDGVDNRFGVSSQLKDYKDNNWHYFIVEYDGSLNNDGVRLFIDGIEQFLSKATGVYAQDSISLEGSEWSKEIQIGRTDDLTGISYYKGKIDDLRIYNRALNEAEIKALYEMGQSQNLNTTFHYRDDFNTINQDFWYIVRMGQNWQSNVLDYNSVGLSNGEINLLMDRTDDGPVMYSKALRVNSGDIIKVKRKESVK